MPANTPNTKDTNKATTDPADDCAGFPATLPFLTTASTTTSLVLISYPIINPDKTQPQMAQPI